MRNCFCPVSVSCVSFNSFVLLVWQQELGLLVLCEQHICLCMWPQGLGLLVLCEQHI